VHRSGIWGCGEVNELQNSAAEARVFAHTTLGPHAFQRR
jgi:hypothetical protein